MGAETFCRIGTGATAKAAFNDLVEDARYQNGNGGYSGTIAEKTEFKVIVPGDLPALFTDDQARRQWFYARADRYIDENDRRINDKWGPAGCMVIKDGEYMFFGWASS